MNRNRGDKWRCNVGNKTVAFRIEAQVRYTDIERQLKSGNLGWKV